MRDFVGGYQGDVALSDDDLKHLRSRRQARAVSNEEERKWPYGIVPYEISNDFNGKLCFLFYPSTHSTESTAADVCERRIA